MNASGPGPFSTTTPNALLTRAALALTKEPVSLTAITSPIAKPCAVFSSR